MAQRLTHALVRKALPPDRGQRFLWDSDIGGFALRITSSGAKAFVIDYRSKRRQRRLTIGSYPDWTVAAARDEARKIRRLVDRGIDPMAQRHAEASAPSVRDLWERYSAGHLPTKAARTQADERSMWEKLILPALGTMKVAEVAHDDVVCLHRDITTRRGTPVRANRTIEVLRKAFNLAIRWKWRLDNPAKGIQRNQEEKRTRYLSQQELARLSKALAVHPEKVSANAIRFLMLTGARRGEALNARWDQFDLKAGIWTKPSAHTKQRREHRVPLSAPALLLLSELKRSAEGPYVFPGKRQAEHLRNTHECWVEIREEAGLPDLRIHDLRHTFASVLASGGASLQMIGKLLGHAQVTTTARYAHLFDDPLREALQIVGDVMADKPSAEVVPIKKDQSA